MLLKHGGPYTTQACVPLATANLVVVCIVQRGVPGGGIEGGSTARDATFTALLYDPDQPAGQRLSRLATSGIHR